MDNGKETGNYNLGFRVLGLGLRESGFKVDVTKNSKPNASCEVGNAVTWTMFCGGV